MDIRTVIAMTMAIIIFIIELAFSVFGVWAIISIIDVAVHNLAVNPVYSDWNLFEVLFNINK
jgi:hypothetical protein